MSTCIIIGCVVAIFSTLAFFGHAFSGRNVELSMFDLAFGAVKKSAYGYVSYDSNITFITIFVMQMIIVVLCIIVLIICRLIDVNRWRPTAAIVAAFFMLIPIMVTSIFLWSIAFAVTLENSSI